MANAIRMRVGLWIAFTIAAWVALISPQAAWKALYEGYRDKFEGK